MNHKLRHLSKSQRRSRHSLNPSPELLTGQSYCNSNFFPQTSSYYIPYGQIREEDRVASVQTTVPTDFFLDCAEDIVLPAAFNDLSPLARELQPLRLEHRNEVHRFLCAFFDLSRFNTIRKVLWLIAVHGAPRSL